MFVLLALEHDSPLHPPRLNSNYLLSWSYHKTGLQIPRVEQNLIQCTWSRSLGYSQIKYGIMQASYNKIFLHLNVKFSLGLAPYSSSYSMGVIKMGYNFAKSKGQVFSLTKHLHPIMGTHTRSMCAFNF